MPTEDDGDKPDAISSMIDKSIVKIDCCIEYYESVEDLSYIDNFNYVKETLIKTLKHIND